MRALTRTNAAVVSRTESAFRANSGPSGPTGSITLRDSRSGTDVKPR